MGGNNFSKQKRQKPLKSSEYDAIDLQSYIKRLNKIFEDRRIIEKLGFKARLEQTANQNEVSQIIILRYHSTSKLFLMTLSTITKENSITLK